MAQAVDQRHSQFYAPMKRLCVFYKRAHDWLGKPIEWIVCKECQKRLRRGEWLNLSYQVGAPDTLRKAPARPVLEELRRLNEIASHACTCDGRNTNGCAACVAERQLRNLGVRSISNPDRFTVGDPRQ